MSYDGTSSDDRVWPCKHYLTCRLAVGVVGLNALTTDRALSTEVQDIRECTRFGFIWIGSTKIFIDTVVLGQLLWVPDVSSGLTALWKRWVGSRKFMNVQAMEVSVGLFRWDSCLIVII